MPYLVCIDAVLPIKHNALLKARNINGDMFCSVVLGCASGEELGSGG